MYQNLEIQIDQVADQVRTKAAKILNNTTERSSVKDAMSYMMLSEGKMLRAFLTFEFAKIAKISEEIALEIALAIELIHAYSLIHDDLPDMDNSNMRRGRASCHVKYDPAIAILAGDALQALGFRILADMSCEVKYIPRIIALFADMIGMNGMVEGQYLDIKADMRDRLEIINMLNLKTGKLIEFSCIAPFFATAYNKNILRIARNYAQRIGLAYQIKDDLLDLESDSAVLGKDANQDIKNNKKNILGIYNPQQAKNELEKLISEAKEIMMEIGQQSGNLLLFADLIRNRKK